MALEKTQPMIRGKHGSRITLDDAMASEGNILTQHLQWENECELVQRIADDPSVLVALTSHHLGTCASRIAVDMHPPRWGRGGFNLVLPMLVDNQPRAVFRVPVPSFCAEIAHPGSAGEKVRSEVATYVWMERHCPEVRVPKLYGFGLPDGGHVSFLSCLFSSLFWNITAMIDLEWIVAAPASMMRAPKYLQSCDASMDTLADEYTKAYAREEEEKEANEAKEADETQEPDGSLSDSYTSARTSFMSLFREQETRMMAAPTWHLPPRLSLSDVMNDSWTSGRYWLYAILRSSNALFHIVRTALAVRFHVQPDMLGPEVWRLAAPDAAELVLHKVRDREAYVERVKTLF